MDDCSPCCQTVQLISSRMSVAAITGHVESHDFEDEVDQKNEEMGHIKGTRLNK